MDRTLTCIEDMLCDISNISALPVSGLHYQGDGLKSKVPGLSDPLTVARACVYLYLHTRDHASLSSFSAQKDSARPVGAGPRLPGCWWLSPMESPMTGRNFLPH